jgi:DNA polymerase III epsilon subunit-like protein
MTHYVIDLETLGKKAPAPIVAIGCVRIGGHGITGERYWQIDLASAMAHGGVPDASTILWWLQQCDDARREINGSTPSLELPLALEQLREFMLEDPGERLVWGNGATFDNAILRRALDDCSIEAPWPYWADRDLRTILDLYPEAKRREFEGVKHHALHDARHEAHQLIAALRLHERHPAARAA